MSNVHLILLDFLILLKSKIELIKYLFRRWSELTRKLEFHVEVQELSDSGEYSPVEVQPRTNVGTGMEKSAFHKYVSSLSTSISVFFSWKIRENFVNKLKFFFLLCFSM